MGIGGISIWQLLIIALIIVLLFGTKKLRTLGSDLGGALKGFKSAMSDEDEEKKKEADQLARDEEEQDASDTVQTRTRDADEK